MNPEPHRTHYTEMVELIKRPGTFIFLLVLWPALVVGLLCWYQADLAHTLMLQLLDVCRKTS